MILPKYNFKGMKNPVLSQRSPLVLKDARIKLTASLKKRLTNLSTQYPCSTFPIRIRTKLINMVLKLFWKNLNQTISTWSLYHQQQS